MRIPSGKTDVAIYFVALDATDLRTPKTGLSGFTVYRSRNGGAAVAYTTPTITEISAANMPGLYSLLIDEDTTIASTSDTEEYAVRIVCTGMAPVPRAIELFRRDTTSGKTALVDNNGRVDVAAVLGIAQTATDLGAALAAIATYIDTEVAAIKAKTDNLPAAPAAVGDVPSAAANAAAVQAAVVEAGFSTQDVLKLLLALAAGKKDGFNGTTVHIRNPADTKNRVTLTLGPTGWTAAATDLT